MVVSEKVIIPLSHKDEAVIEALALYVPVEETICCMRFEGT